MQRFFFLFSLLLLYSNFASASPNSITFQSRIVKPDGYPLEGSAVNFRFSITDTVGSCVVYQEDFTNRNMSGSKGLINLALGAGTKVFPVAAMTLAEVFNNYNSPTLNCQAGGNITVGVTDRRKLIVQFNDGSGWQTVPSMDIISTPFAMQADSAIKLGDFPAGDYVRTATFPTCVGGEALHFNGASFTCVAVGSGSGTVTSVTSANGDITVTNTTTTPQVTLNVGTGNNQIVKLDGAAALPAVSGVNLTALNATNLGSGTVPAARMPALAGDVTMTAGTTATSIAANVIVDADINAAAAIARSKLAVGSANHVVVNDGVTGALSSIGCVNGELIKWAAGVPTCSTDLAGVGDIINGGNATGATVSVGTTDAQSFALKTNNTTAMTILSNGNIGIGTTGPTVKLNFEDIAGTNAYGVIINHTGVAGSTGAAIRAYQNALSSTSIGVLAEKTTSGGFAVYGNSSAQAGSSGVGLYGITYGTASGSGVAAHNVGSNNTGYALFAFNNSATGWGVYSSGTSPNYFAGNVGVGTNAPTSPLTVKGGSTSTTPAIDTTNAAGASIIKLHDDFGNGMLQVLSSSGAIITKMSGHILNNPNLWLNGSGSNKPDGAYDNAGVGLYVQVPNAVGNENGIFFSNSTSGGHAGAGITHYISDITGFGRGGLKFKTTNAGTPTTRMTIDPTGKVGIGTTGPSANLHVGADAAGTTTVQIDKDSNASGGNFFLNDVRAGANRKYDLYFGTGGSYRAAISGGQDAGAASYLALSTAAEALRIDSAGNVGVGTISPAAKLDIADTGTTTSAIIVPRAGNFTGTEVNGMVRYNTTSTLFEFRQNGAWVNYTTVSDGRLKTNVEPVVNGLDIVNQLNPVFYDWDRNNPKASSFADKHQVGFIAQEIEKVLPEVVNQGEDSYRSVEYGQIVSVVVAAVKELYSKVLGIDRDLASVKNQVDVKLAQIETENSKLLMENVALKARLDQQEKELATIKKKLGL